MDKDVPCTIKINTDSEICKICLSKISAYDFGKWTELKLYKKNLSDWSFLYKPGNEWLLGRELIRRGSRESMNRL